MLPRHDIPIRQYVMYAHNRWALASVLCFMPDSSDISAPRFIHRFDTFGTYHSICRGCGQSIAKDERESKLIAGGGEAQMPRPSCYRFPSPIAGLD